MAREKKTVHKVQMTDGKRQIIQQLLQEYDIETAEDIQDALLVIINQREAKMMITEMDIRLSVLIPALEVLISRFHRIEILHLNRR